MQPGCTRKLSDIQYDKSDTTLIEIIRAQQRGWVRAISILFKRYENELLRRCQYRLGDFHDAEDVVQATLLRVYRAIRMFEGKSSFRSWLYTIADNQCNTLATRRSRHVLSEHLITLIDIHEHALRSHDAFMDKEQVNLTLNILPAKTKQILKMRYYMDLSLEEIAHTLGIGPSAAKMRLYRAQDTFKQHYHEPITTR